MLGTFVHIKYYSNMEAVSITLFSIVAIINKKLSLNCNFKFSYKWQNITVLVAIILQVVL